MPRTCDQASTVSADTWLQCVGIGVSTPDDPSLEQFLIQAGGSDSYPWIMNTGKAMLRRNRLIYGADSFPGGDPNEDCGSANYSASDVGGLALGAAGQAAGLAGGVGGLVGATATLAPFLGPIGLGIAALTIPFAIIAAHAKKVAQEKNLLCGVTTGYNAYADQIEVNLKSGKITVVQASQTLAQVVAQLEGQLRGMIKQGNGPYGMGIILKAILAYNVTVVYPALASGDGSASGSGLLILGIAALGAKLLGVF